MEEFKNFKRNKINLNMKKKNLNKKEMNIYNKVFKIQTLNESLLLILKQKRMSF